MKFYGNNTDTFLETSKGLFLVQSPDMTAKWEDHTEFGLPDDCRELSPALCWDLEIPECLLEKGEGK